MRNVMARTEVSLRVEARLGMKFSSGLAYDCIHVHKIPCPVLSCVVQIGALPFSCRGRGTLLLLN